MEDCFQFTLQRPVVTIKVFFVKENFDKVFDETLIVTTVKEIFDQKL
jgi:hypothetical protein